MILKFSCKSITDLSIYSASQQASTFKITISFPFLPTYTSSGVADSYCFRHCISSDVLK